jgi:O-antigen/teichoic acid export membrane protein
VTSCRGEDALVPDTSPVDSAPAPAAESREDVVAGAMRGLFGRDSLYLALSLLQVIGAAAVTPVITRQLDSAAFGGVASANAAMQVLLILAGAGLNLSIQRWYAQRDGSADAARLLTLGMLTALVVSVVAMVTVPAWGPAMGFGGDQDVVRLAVGWAGLGAVTGCSLALLRSQDRLAAYAAVGLFQSVVAEFLSLALVMGVSPTASAFLWGQVIAQVVACAIGLVCAPPRLIRLRDAPLLRAGLVLALPMIPASLGSFALTAADRLIINGQMGEAAVGRYQVAYNIGALPTLALGMLTAVWMPRFFAVHDEDHRSAVLTASRDALYRLLGPILIGMAAGVPILLRLWAPASYRPDQLTFMATLIVVSAVPYTAGLAATRVLLSRGSTRLVAWATLGGAVLNIGLNLVLIQVWGLEGAALATLIAFAGQHLLLLTRGRSEPSPGPLLGRAWVQVLLASGVAMLLVLVPVGTAGIAVRLLVGLLCLAWFGWELRRAGAGGPRAPRRPRHRPRRSAAQRGG